MAEREVAARLFTTMGSRQGDRPSTRTMKRTISAPGIRPLSTFGNQRLVDILLSFPAEVVPSRKVETKLAGFCYCEHCCAMCVHIQSGTMQR